ncbi:MAG: NADH-quinone oxidoreductase subunit J [Rhodobacteraceae bacterium]|nr:NADH-quinone oxidoreductase subunit J [Paracoccaceae bacterium]
MLIQTAVFALFAALAVGGGFGVVFSRNPVRAVLWLILAFLAAAGLFVLQGAEFVAMLLVIVYVGAVAVLFLFVVMMLDVDFATLRAGMARSIPVGILISLLILMMIVWQAGRWSAGSDARPGIASPTPPLEEAENTVALGRILYTDHVLLFQIAGLILLVAMIGAIVLTFRHKSGVKRQDVVRQMYRDPAQSIELKDVDPGKGLR